MRRILLFLLVSFPAFGQPQKIVDTVLPNGDIQRVVTSTTTVILKQKQYESALKDIQENSSSLSSQAATMQPILSQSKIIAPEHKTTPVISLLSSPAVTP